MSKNVIDIKKSLKRFFWESLLTFSGWALVINSVVQLISTILIWLYNLIFFNRTVSQNNEVIRVFIIMISLAVFIFLLIIFWSQYNLKKYGKLQRRVFPSATTDEEVASFFQIESNELELLKKRKVNVFIN